VQSLLSTLGAPLATLFAWPISFAIAAIITFAISLGVCLAIILTARHHCHLTSDHLDEVQKIHSGQIPRIGGLAIVIALAYAGSELLAVRKIDLMLLLGLAALPAFVFGILEDLTRRVSVRARFMATLAAGVVGCYVLEHTLHSVGFESIDAILSYSFIAIVFTAIASAGLATSINIIDGLNGLSSFISIAILIGLAALANQAGDVDVYKVAILGAVAIAGFAVCNWPLSKIFLGDGGAYFIGFFIAWIAILIRSRDGSISAFAMLLVCAYPVIETLFSMARRTGFKKLVGAPDQKHLHHLIFFHVKYTLGVPQKWANSVAGLLTALLAIPPIVLALQYPSNKDILIALFATFVGLYLALYIFLQKTARIVHVRQMSSSTQAKAGGGEFGHAVYSYKE